MNILLGVGMCDAPAIVRGRCVTLSDDDAFLLSARLRRGINPMFKFSNIWIFGDAFDCCCRKF